MSKKIQIKKNLFKKEVNRFIGANNFSHNF